MQISEDPPEIEFNMPQGGCDSEEEIDAILDKGVAAAIEAEAAEKAKTQ